MFKVRKAGLKKTVIIETFISSKGKTDSTPFIFTCYELTQELYSEEDIQINSIQ